MFSLRYSDIKAACAKAVNLCTDDSQDRVIDYVNRAVERLLYEGKWKGTTQTFRLCMSAENCIVWPREIETIEAIAPCNWPAPIRSEWFEFTENGFGVISDEANCLHALVDRGETCAFDEVVGSNKKLAVYADKDEGSGKFITLQFYDQYGQWVRTQYAGAWIDGEKLAIPATKGSYVYTTNIVKPGGLVRVQKDITHGVIRLYSYDTTSGALVPLAYYQPDEEVPVYRRSLLPIGANNSCEQQSVVVAAKLRFIPVRSDDNFVMISHREAIRLACRAIYQEENDLWSEATTNWAAALRCLGMQLEHYQGHGMKPVIRVQSPATFGGGQLYAIQ